MEHYTFPTSITFLFELLCPKSRQCVIFQFSESLIDICTWDSLSLSFLFPFSHFRSLHTRVDYGIYLKIVTFWTKRPHNFFWNIFHMFRIKLEWCQAKWGCYSKNSKSGINAKMAVGIKTSWKHLLKHACFLGHGRKTICLCQNGGWHKN